MKVFFGKIVHTTSLNEFEIFTNGFIAINDEGKIIGVGNSFDEWRKQNPIDKYEEVRLTDSQFLMPGLVDCHIHAPQVAQIGLGLDMPLLDWLNTYTFPLEAKFASTSFAKNVYNNVVRNTIRCGTTLASYFATNSKDSSLILAEEAIKQGQRALIGKVCSDCNSPDFYVETTEDSTEATREFVTSMLSLGSELVKPTITPRFALSCSRELLCHLGEIARKHDLNIQSHISESIAEIEFVKSIFQCSYAKAYDNAGLLTNKTIMAHGVHLEDDEINLLKERGTSVAHCPASNTCLSSGFCDVLRLLKNGIKVGLGTDVSGGNSMSVQDAILRALDVSHHLEFIKKQNVKGSGSLQQRDDSYVPLNYKQAIYLATLGGAESLSLADVTGNFMKGKDFDALLIDVSVYPTQEVYTENSDTQKDPKMKLLEMVQKFVYVGDDRNILKVFVAGRQIKIA